MSGRCESWRRLTCVTAVCIWFLTHLAAQPAPLVSREAEETLQKATAFAVQFREHFAHVLGIEQYDQAVLRSTVHRGPRSRHITSEVFFTSLGEPPVFMTVRSAERVDGRGVPGAHQRVVDALSAGSSASRLRLLTTLASEGARYNLGAVGRTFNDPTLALMFVSPEWRRRFVFSRGQPSRVAGELTQELQFREIERPSLIRDERDDLDADIHGSMHVTADGRVLGTELIVQIGTRVTARVRVQYGYNSNVQMLVPLTMTEDYRNDDGPGRGVTIVTCTATYSRYRLFDTSVRILPQ